MINTTHRHPTCKSKYITLYNNSDASKEKFRTYINSLNLYATLDTNIDSDPNINYEIIESAIANAMDIHLAKKVVKFNSRKHKKEPWMTDGILNSINHKNKLYKRLKKARSNSPEYDIKFFSFNTYRNSLRRIIYLAKEDHFCKKISESKNNTEKIWQTLNKALNRSPSQVSPETLTIDNQICTEKNQMANSFNNYFSTICNRDK